MAYFIAILVICGFGYFIIRKMVAKDTPSSSGGSRPAGNPPEAKK